jgi:hypothetical protein
MLVRYQKDATKLIASQWSSLMGDRFLGIMDYLRILSVSLCKTSFTMHENSEAGFTARADSLSWLRHFVTIWE